MTTENDRKDTTPDSQKNIVYSTQNLDLWYGENHALQNINLDILETMLQRLSDHQVVVNQHISKHSIVWLNSYLQLKLQENFISRSKYL